MSFSRILRINRYLLFANIIVLLTFFVFFVSHLSQNIHGNVIEANSIVLKGKNGVPLLQMQAGDGAAVMIFNDENGTPRLQFQGGALPAMMIKNETNDVVGSLFTLKDGGGALGLGDFEGDVSTFLRGGASPNLSFFEKSPEPNLSLGITNHVPHFLLFPKSGKDGMMIHGGSPTSLVFVDEHGKIPVAITKSGLKQKEFEEEVEEKEKKFLFSWDILKNSILERR
ncbi:MAG: hypothetical protein KAR79_00185 [Simkaniaceae bacterium]|nr:hypothetical protein [Simkaniaceae bacterium]